MILAEALHRGVIRSMAYFSLVIKEAPRSRVGLKGSRRRCSFTRSVALTPSKAGAMIARVFGLAPPATGGAMEVRTGELVEVLAHRAGEWFPDIPRRESSLQCFHIRAGAEDAAGPTGSLSRNHPVNC